MSGRVLKCAKGLVQLHLALVDMLLEKCRQQTDLARLQIGSMSQAEMGTDWNERNHCVDTGIDNSQLL